MTSGVWHAWEHYSMSKGAEGEFRVFLLPPEISFPGLDSNLLELRPFKFLDIQV